MLYNTLFDHIAITDIQFVLKTIPGVDIGSVDGFVGRLTWNACRKALETCKDVPEDFWDTWPNKRKAIAIEQLVMRTAGINTGTIDGFYGPDTAYAVEMWQNHSGEIPSTAPCKGSPWPKEKDTKRFYGAAGTNQVRLELPYTMKIAWNLDESVTSFMINKKCAESAKKVFIRVLQHYGEKKIDQLGLNLFAGCFNARPKRGTKNTPSMHTYACAIDVDSAHNRWRWGKDKARFAREDYDAWFMFWEEEHWVSLGRTRGYDYMHVQAAH